MAPTSSLNDPFSSNLFNWSLLIILLLLIYSGYATFILFFKQVKANKQLKKLDKQSTIWHLHDINQHVKDVFEKIQTACQQDSPELLRDIMTQHLYAHYSLAMQQLDDQNIKDVIKHAKLHSFAVLSLQKNRDDTQDVLWVYVKFSKTEFELSKADQQLVDGNPGMPYHYKQLWKFELEEGQWKLAIIRENVHLKDIEALSSDIAI